MVEELMTDTVKADRCDVPDTGVDPDWEYQLSSIFIDTEKGQVNMYDSTRFLLFCVKSLLMVDVDCSGKCHAHLQLIQLPLFGNSTMQRDAGNLFCLFQARYGTRSMAAIAVKLDGEVTFYERCLDNSLWKENLMQFQMEVAK